MRAVLCEAFGPPETLTLREVPDPEPGPGEVRVRVQACGVNFPDTLIIENRYQIKPDLPFSPGGEVAGVVDALGEGVDGVAEGDAVIAMTTHGGFAEAVVTSAAALLPRPASMSPEVAAGFAMTYGTSMHALRQRADLQPGESLLVLGAGGGVGLAAVEIGRAMGATVIAAASSAEKLEAAREAGAEHLVNYAEDDLRARLKEIVGRDGVDVVYDPVGGPLFEAALRSTAWEGRALVVGFASGEIPRVPTNLALLKGCSVVGVFWGAFRRKDPQADRANFERLFAWHAEGRLRPHVSRVLPLERAAEALAELAGRRAVGKLVLSTGQGAA